MADRLVRWDPFRDLASIQGELNRLFGRTFAGTEPEPSFAGSWVPPLDVYETPEKLVVTVELPGIDPSDVDVSVENSTLAISGSREFYSDAKEENFHRVERRFGSFQRMLSLPSTANADNIDATFDKGVLTIEVPKKEEAKPKKITIKASG